MTYDIVTNIYISREYDGITEVNVVDGTSRMYDVNLPVATHFHDVLKVDETHVVLINVGATVDALADDNAWILDTTQMSWTALPRMGFARTQAMAGIVTRLDGHKELVVAGGVYDVSPHTKFQEILLTVLICRNTKTPCPGQ